MYVTYMYMYVTHKLYLIMSSFGAYRNMYVCILYMYIHFHVYIFFHLCLYMHVYIQYVNVYYILHVHCIYLLQ